MISVLSQYHIRRAVKRLLCLLLSIRLSWILKHCFTRLDFERMPALHCIAAVPSDHTRVWCSIVKYCVVGSMFLNKPQTPPCAFSCTPCLFVSNHGMRHRTAGIGTGSYSNDKPGDPTCWSCPNVTYNAIKSYVTTLDV